MPAAAARILVDDDEPAMREVLEARLLRWGYDVKTAASAAQARGLLPQFRPQVVVSDLVLSDATGLDLLRELRAADPSQAVVVITAYGTIDTAVRAIKGGATHFLTKPLDYAALRAHIDEILAAKPEGAPVAAATTSGSPATWAGLVGTSVAMRDLQERVRGAANSDAPVFIVGESGTGKELVARAVVELSRRAHAPFIAVNAAAMPESLIESELFGVERGAFTGADRARPGFFEQANGGSLFLDEITEMPIAVQPKLLRVLEDHRVRRVGGRAEIPCDVRVIAATNRNPTEAVAAGVLRHDLAWRLDVLRIHVPPLRERREDVPALAAHFVEACGRRYGVEGASITAAAQSALARRDWPGNVRELKNAVERAFVVAERGAIDVAHVGGEAGAGDAEEPQAPEDRGIVIPQGVTLADAERIVILETLKRAGNNKTETARRLGLDVKTIRNKLKAFGVDGPGGDGGS